MDLATAWLGEVRAMVSGLRDIARVEPLAAGDHEALAGRYIDVLFSKLSRGRDQLPSSVNVACVVSHAVLNIVMHPRVVTFNDVSGYMNVLLKDRGVSAPGKQRLEKVSRAMRTLACEGVHAPEARGNGGIEHCSRCMLVLSREPAGTGQAGDATPLAMDPGTTPLDGWAGILATLVDAPRDDLVAALADAIRLHERCKGPVPGDDPSTVVAIAAGFLGRVNLSEVARHFPTSRSTLSNRVIGIAKAALDDAGIARLGQVDFPRLREAAARPAT